MTTSVSRKHKRVVLLLESKLCVLDRLAKGERATVVASDFRIGNSTVNDLKKESRIWSFIMKMECLSVCLKERKIMRLPKNVMVDENLYLWYIKKGAKEFRLHDLF